MSGARPSARWVHVVAALVMLAGCRHLLGLDGAAGGGLPVCGLAFAPETCDACMTGACCDAMTACVADAECAALLGCIGACAGDDGCRSGCRGTHPAGLGRLGFDVLACQASSCASVCGVACGGYLYPSDSCAGCGKAHCCDSATACAVSADCSSLAACERGCLKAADYYGCVGDCIHGAPAGIDASRALGLCLGEACLATCGDPAWTCLDTVTWPPATTAPVDIGITVNEYTTGAPVPGASVRLCNVTDEACAAPIAGPQTTGMDGLTTFPMVAASATAIGLYLEVTGGGLFPALYFLGPAPIAADVHLSWNFVGAVTAQNLAGVPLDPSRGQIVLQVRGCLDARPAGVTLAGEGPGLAGSVPFYQRNGLPVTGVTTTDASGIAGFLDVAPGNVTLQATIASTGELLGAAALFVRAGWASYLPLPPSPR